MVTALVSFFTIGIASFVIMAIAYLLSGWLGPVGGAISNVLLLNLVVVMVFATLLTMAERKWSALLQNRVGPNRIRVPVPFFGRSALGGLPHIIPDVVKLLTKELTSPRAASQTLFKLAPMLAFAPVFVLFAVIPVGPTLLVNGTNVEMVGASPDFGLLFILAMASLAVYGTSIAGWASNNKFALLGGVRASSQMISYEVALGLSLVGMMVAFSTVSLTGTTGMSELQSGYLLSGHLGSFDIGLPKWGFLLQPVGFFLFFAAAFAETKRTPFDAPEGESEIVGYFVEYSGMQFGMFMISEFVEIVVLSGVLVAVFFGAWWLPFGNEWIMSLSVMRDHPWILGAFYGTVFWLKVLLFCFIQLVIRWTYPRFRYDQIQHLGWKILIPLGLFNMFLTGALVLVDPSLQLLVKVGILELVVLAFFTITPAAQLRRRISPDAAHHET